MRLRALVLALLFCCTLLLTSGRADAHAVGLSTGEYVAHGSTLVAKIAFARNEVAALAPNIDRNSDGHVTAAEVRDGRPLLIAKVLRRIHVTQAGVDCAAALDDAGLTEQDGILLSAHWTCPATDKPFDVELVILDDLARGHRHVARALEGEVAHDEVLFGDQKTITVPPEPQSGTTGDPSEARAPEAPGAKSGFAAFFVMGIEHILTGYDHLVFIFGLVLIRARLRDLLSVITAFTVAHSITLAIAVLGIWTPSSRIVEPAIALSIAYVGVDNLIKPSASKRWRITFPFGLVHGFGFAGALKEIGLAKSAIPTALVAFNVGVESGQLAVLSVLLPIVIVLRAKTSFDPWGMRIASIFVLLAGLVWFVARVVSPG